jgi:hypothetical protein
MNDIPLEDLDEINRGLPSFALGNFTGLIKRPKKTTGGASSIINEETAGLLNGYAALKKVIAAGEATDDDIRAIHGGYSLTHFKIDYDMLGDHYVSDYRALITPEEFDVLVNIYKRRNANKENFRFRISRFTKLEIPTAASVREYLYDYTPILEAVHKNIVDGVSFETRKMSTSNKYKLYLLMYNDELRAGSEEHLAVADQLHLEAMNLELAETNAIRQIMGLSMVSEEEMLDRVSGRVRHDSNAV